MGGRALAAALSQFDRLLTSRLIRSKDGTFWSGPVFLGPTRCSLAWASFPWLSDSSSPSVRQYTDYLFQAHYKAFSTSQARPSIGKWHIAYKWIQLRGSCQCQRLFARHSSTMRRIIIERQISQVNTNCTWHEVTLLTGVRFVCIKNVVDRRPVRGFALKLKSDRRNVAPRTMLSPTPPVGNTSSQKVIPWQHRCNHQKICRLDRQCSSPTSTAVGRMQLEQTHLHNFEADTSVHTKVRFRTEISVWNIHLHNSDAQVSIQGDLRLGNMHVSALKFVSAPKSPFS
jgi:hypothetical protein